MSMFNPIELAATLDLHERSYALLQWVRGHLTKGVLSFAVVHRSTDSAMAAQEWISRHFENLPRGARPEVEDLPAFARLFASYLTTSFRLQASATRLVSDCGCYCSWCAYLRAAPTLEVREPARRDARVAKELKRLYVGNLAIEAGIDLSSTSIERIVDDSALHQRLALATWTSELLRRREFASQGEGVLVLWREFAWHAGRPRKNFRLCMSEILAAEAAVLAAIGGN